MGNNKKAKCTECGKVVASVKEMIEHYKEHPEITVIDGLNELEVMEQLKKNEQQKGDQHVHDKSEQKV